MNIIVTHMKIWIQALRLRTLLLALSSVGMGSFLAISIDQFRYSVFLFATTTTVFLQILSNLANDYGDSLHGADNQMRQGPTRTVQTGQISARAMYIAMIILVILSLVSGIGLLIVSIHDINTLLFFLALGFLSIMAAITYTAGPKPYGYVGLGDIAVMVFFGWVGVLGTFYLHTGFINWLYWLPATSCGCFATAVLNVNNIRDITSDRLAGKNSIPVRLGRTKARIYHALLLTTGLVCALLFVLLNYHHFYQLFFLITLPLLLKNGFSVAKLDKPKELDPLLKQMSITTALFVLTFGIGLVYAV